MKLECEWNYIGKLPNGIEEFYNPTWESECGHWLTVQSEYENPSNWERKDCHFCGKPMKVNTDSNSNLSVVRA